MWALHNTAPLRSSFKTQAVSTSPHHMLEGRVAEITLCEEKKVLLPIAIFFSSLRRLHEQKYQPLSLTLADCEAINLMANSIILNPR